MTRNLFGKCLNLRPALLVLVTTGIVVFSTNSFAQYEHYEATAYIPSGNEFGRTTTPGDVSYTYDSGLGHSAVATFTTSPVASVSYETTAHIP